MGMSKISKIIESFTEEQAAVYNAMLGDKKKLKADWDGCRKMYDDAAKVIADPKCGPEVRLLLRNITDYWNRRRLAMERLLERTENSDLLTKWKSNGIKTSK